MPNENEDNELIACITCSTQYESDELYSTSGGDKVCSDCMRTCEHCEWVGTEDDSWHTVSDELWCEGCWENESVYCDRCDYTYNGDRVSTNHINGVIGVSQFAGTEVPDPVVDLSSVTRSIN